MREEASIARMWWGETGVGRRKHGHNQPKGASLPYGCSFRGFSVNAVGKHSEILSRQGCFVFPHSCERRAENKVGYLQSSCHVPGGKMELGINSNGTRESGEK